MANYLFQWIWEFFFGFFVFCFFVSYWSGTNCAATKRKQNLTSLSVGMMKKMWNVKRNLFHFLHFIIHICILTFCDFSDSLLCSTQVIFIFVFGAQLNDTQQIHMHFFPTRSSTLFSLWLSFVFALVEVRVLDVLRDLPVKKKCTFANLSQT